MALTDSDRLHAAGVAIMRHNVISHQYILANPIYTQNFTPTKYLDVYETLSATANLSTPTYSYVIE